MKKFIGGVLAAALLVSPFGQTALANEDEEYFPDPWYYYSAEDIEGHWSQEDMENMLQADIIRGVRGADDLLYLQPEAKITRAQFTTLVVRALELETDKPGKAFTDIGKHWAKEEINIASALGIINGKTDTEFKPDMNITRAEIAKIIKIAFDPSVTFEDGTPKSFSDLKTSHWAYKYIREVSGVDILRGKTTTTVEPDSNAKRSEASVMLKRALWLENIDLPTDEEVTGLILSSESDTLTALNAQNVDGLYEVNELTRFGLGYETGAYDAWFIDTFIFDAGETLTGEIASHPSMGVEAVSSRLVKVNVENFIIDYVQKDAEGNVIDEFSDDRSGEYYLIKRYGEWNVYSSDWLKLYLEF
ncbi:S-layer homology domain-containing protein [Fictibacillus nanhaiensis]|uniref:S-layer homology domain-containing protein n=1 Tax=Fictibacillus nanhaiensis TaxID=742169 RepID=UPI00203C715C|nr:S-layer homology domain-containing protein [Fictibacillus nanhaiensis]MCM3734220.1 S-layer homology domain-containing protein [Fictibacillus nanhaiensis]